MGRLQMNASPAVENPEGAAIIALTRRRDPRTETKDPCAMAYIVLTVTTVSILITVDPLRHKILFFPNEKFLLMNQPHQQAAAQRPVR